MIQPDCQAILMGLFTRNEALQVTFQACSPPQSSSFAPGPLLFQGGVYHNLSDPFGVFYCLLVPLVPCNLCQKCSVVPYSPCHVLLFISPLLQAIRESDYNTGLIGTSKTLPPYRDGLSRCLQSQHLNQLLDVERQEAISASVLISEHLNVLGN